MSASTLITNNNLHLLNFYQKLGSALIILQVLFILIPTITFEVGIFIIPILQMGKLRPRDTGNLSTHSLVSA